MPDAPGPPKGPHVPDAADAYADDARLLAALGDLLAEADPVPPEVQQAARAAFQWRLVDSDLARLVEDSAVSPMAGVRSPAGARLLTFEAGPLTVVVEVAERGTQRRLLGQLVPPGPAAVEVRHAGGALSVPADELGRFTVESLPAGPVSLVCRTPAREPPVVTSWVSV